MDTDIDEAVNNHIEQLETEAALRMTEEMKSIFPEYSEIIDLKWLKVVCRMKPERRNELVPKLEDLYAQ